MISLLKTEKVFFHVSFFVEAFFFVSSRVPSSAMGSKISPSLDLSLNVLILSPSFKPTFICSKRCKNAKISEKTIKRHLTYFCCTKITDRGGFEPLFDTARTLVSIIVLLATKALPLSHRSA